MGAVGIGIADLWSGDRAGWGCGGDIPQFWLVSIRRVCGWYRWLGWLVLGGLVREASVGVGAERMNQAI